MLKKALLYSAVLAALYFAVQGGEYSTTALLQQRSREAYLKAAVDSLTREVDSLRALRKAIATDAAVQERLARERYGLVRGDREIVYRFSDTGRSKP